MISEQNTEEAYYGSGSEDDLGGLELDEVAEEYTEDSSTNPGDVMNVSSGEDEGPADGEEDSGPRPFVAELDLHGGEPSYSLAIHPTIPGLFASAGGNDRGVMFCVLDDDEGLTVEVPFQLEGHTDTVEHVQFSPDGDYVATGSMDGTVRIWRVYSGECVHTLEGSGSEVNWIQWNPMAGSTQIAGGTSDGSVWLWDAAEGYCVQVFSGSATTSTCGAFTADGQGLITAGDGAIFSWDLETATPKVTYNANVTGTLPKDIAISLAVHPTMPVAMVGFQEGVVVVVHTQRHQILSIIPTSNGDGEGGIEFVSYMKKIPIMLSAGLDGYLRMWDANNYKSRSVLQMAEGEGISCCTWMSDNSTLIVGGVRGGISVWDVKGGQKKCAFPPLAQPEEENVVYDVSYLKDSNIILAAFDDGKIRMYRSD